MSTLAVNTITNAAGGNTATINGMTPTAQSLQGFRNRIINGDMRIDQRNNGASLALNASNQFPVDRWQAYAGQTSRLTAQRNAGSVTPPVGYTNYLGATSVSTYTAASGDNFYFGQILEGFNVADLAWGTANAAPITVSFWVRASITGTWSGAASNGAAARSYPFTFSISAANTWEQKSVTIPGDTTGTWVTDNGVGMRLYFDLGCGSSGRGTAGAWGGGFFLGATGANSLGAASGATFQITGVQLEAGAVATPFERRPFGAELALCQRYYQKLGLVANQMLGSGITQTGSQGTIYCKYTTTMRASPTATFSNLSVGDDWNYGRIVTTLAGSSFGVDSARLVCGIAQSDMTAQRAMTMQCGGSTSFIDFSAEL